MNMPQPLDVLVRVVPIAQAETRDGIEVTLFSLEAYTNGFIIHGRLLRHADTVGVGEDRGLLRPVIEISDDLGNHYTHRPRSASSDGRETRFMEAFYPALHEDAARLRVAVSDLRRLVVPRRPSADAPREEHVAAGPWVFAVALR